MIYFYDTGIINAATRHFNPLAYRNDVGALFENYLMAERMKVLYQSQIHTESLFWHTTQQEVDYIEKTNDKILTLAFKWTEKGKHKIPLTYTNANPSAQTF